MSWMMSVCLCVCGTPLETITKTVALHTEGMESMAALLSKKLLLN